jgi:hypothetical protein
LHIFDGDIVGRQKGAHQLAATLGTLHLCPRLRFGPDQRLETSFACSSRSCAAQQDYVSGARASLKSASFNLQVSPIADCWQDEWSSWSNVVTIFNSPNTIFKQHAFLKKCSIHVYAQPYRSTHPNFIKHCI